MTTCNGCGVELPKAVNQPPGVPLFCSHRCYNQHWERINSALVEMRRLEPEILSALYELRIPVNITVW